MKSAYMICVNLLKISMNLNHLILPNHRHHTLENLVRQSLGDTPVLKSYFNSNVSTRRLVSEIEEAETAYLVRYEIPGVKKDHVTLQIEGRELSVKVQRKLKNSEEFVTQDSQLKLSEWVQVDAITATLEDGILTLTVPKVEKSAPKVIQIQ